MSSYEPLMSVNDFAHVKSVGVIGAGVAGLQMARALKAHGFSVTVFERAPKVGGLWRENYHSYGVQVPKQFYEFLDFPFDAVKYGDYPTGAETQAYIEAYAKHYDLTSDIKCNTKVMKLKERTEGKKGYIFELETEGKGKSTAEFDFAIVATGMYSQVPNMPDWTKDLGGFEGEIVHSSKYLDQSMAKGKRVVVIGCGKSAIDVTISASEVASEAPTLLFRAAHWSTPRYIAGLIPFQFVFLSRLGQALVSWYKGAWPAGAPCYCTCLSYLLFPIMWLAFRLVELVFAIQRGQWGEFAPKLDVVADFYGYGQVLDTTFLSKWRGAKLKGKLGEVKKLVAGGFETQAGDKYEVDLIICATGFKKTYDYLPDPAKEKLQVQSDGLYLYRHCIPPAVRDINIAFCGSEIATISNIATHGLHAEYICRMLTGKLKEPLPEEAALNDECERMRTWKRSWMPETSSRAALVLLHQIHYHDQLLRDMGERPGRKCGPCEIFCPYAPKDYYGVMTEKTEKAKETA